ncbi:YbgC/FadM family acyl-CoA thioesterase [Candidatus Pelagibacter sp.]|nr:YbgC/FadM family acyl-CoA thioesterase [Candidatus Pelagibacter sp.]
MHKNFIFKTKVYYEDTDAGGVVYYANYLKFIERARTEVIKELGFSNNILINDYDTFFVVKSCNLDFKKYAYLEDELNVNSSIVYISKTSFKMLQEITRENQIIFSSLVHLVAINKNGKIIKIPQLFQNKLQSFLSK